METSAKAQQSSPVVRSVDTEAGIAALGEVDAARLRVLTHEMVHWQTSWDLTLERARGIELREQFERAQEQIRELATALKMVQESRFWKFRALVRSLRARLKLGPPPARDFAIPSPEISQALQDAYALWRTKHTPRSGDIERMRKWASAFAYQPTISILMPTYNTPEAMLRAAIESVIAQAYTNWELCIADDASTMPHVRDVLDFYRGIDARINVIYRPENGHISRTTNSALELATGEYVALLDHDDVLTPDAVFEVVAALNVDRDIDMIYSDEDKIDEFGGLSQPYFKPDWCPDSLLGRMYTCHFAVFRRRIINEIGGFRPDFDGSQDYDLVLRVTERTDKVHHIPQILYHWRQHDASAASNTDAKGYAYLAGKRAIEESLARRGEPAEVIPVQEAPGAYVVRFAIRKPGKVSIIIPTRDHGDDVDRCLTSIFSNASYGDFEVLLVDNGSTDRDSIEIFRSWAERDSRVRVLYYDIPFNFSAINNYAALEATGTYLLFLNNDTEVTTSDWLHAMVGWAQRDSIGAVGAKLIFNDGTIQHAGVVMAIGGVAGHSHKHFPRDSHGYFNMLKAPNNYMAVTAACLMMRKSIFEEVGGFDETFAVAFNDVDLCLRIGAAGYRLVSLPDVELFHYESKSRGYDDTPEKAARSLRERLLMESRWSVSGMHDTCYSPHLSLTCEDFSIRL